MQTILVVEDDDDVRDMLCLVLSAEGYAATGASDGLEALRQMRQGESPALLILDMRMPRMDGEALIRAMAADAPLAKIPIVVISGQLTVETESPAPQVIARMVKPIELNGLLEIVQRFASRTPHAKLPAAHLEPS